MTLEMLSRQIHFAVTSALFRSLDGTVCRDFGLTFTTKQPFPLEKIEDIYFLLLLNPEVIADFQAVCRGTLPPADEGWTFMD